RIKQTYTGFAAGSAASLRVQSPRRDLIPIASDQPRAARSAISALAVFIVDISGVHIMEPRRERDVARTRQRCGWRVELTLHLPGGVERSKMQWHIGTALTQHPFAQARDLCFGVVFAWDQQGRDLEPGVRLLLHIAQRVEDSMERPRAEPLVE